MHRTMLAFLVWFLIAGSASAAPSVENPQYTATQLDLRPVTMNNLGQVLGHTQVWLPDVPNGTTGRVWDMGVITPDKDPFPEHGIITEAHGINDNGEVVGISGSGMRYKGLSFAGAFKTRIGKTLDKSRLLKTETGSVPYDINNRGVIVGETEDASTSHAVKWSPAGRLAPLGKLRKDDPYCGAKDINEIGTIVGYSGPYPDWRAWVLTGMHKRDLGPGQAKAVNDHNAIVGVSERRACLWAASKRLLLDQKDYASDYPLDGRHPYSTAFDINNAGMIVGFVSASKEVSENVWEAQSHAALWKDGGAVDLNDVVVLPEGRVLERAVAINNKGQILCSSGGKAVLLTPVAPSADTPAP